MANRAIRRKARAYVAGIVRAVEVRLVTGIAVARRVCVIVVDVALRAGKTQVRAGKRIVGIQRGVETGIEPIDS